MAVTGREAATAAAAGSALAATTPAALLASGEAPSEALNPTFNPGCLATQW